MNGALPSPLVEPGRAMQRTRRSQRGCVQNPSATPAHLERLGRADSLDPARGCIFNEPMKKLLRVVIVLGILIVLVLGVGVLFADRAAKVAVEQGGEYALGVRTQLDSANLSPLRGKLSLSELTVANPAGFDQPNFLTLKGADVDVEMSTLLSEEVIVDELVIDGMELTLEKKGGRENYDEILKHLQTLRSKDKKPPETEGASEKKFVIRKVLVRGLVAHVHYPPLAATTVRVPEVRMTNVGGEGQTIDVAYSNILQASLASIVQNRANLPEELIDGLGAQLAKLGDGVLQIGPGAGKALEEVGKQAGGALEEAAKGLEGIFKKQ